MGSPLSLVIANLCLDSLEETALQSASFKPKLWVRYVDDTFVIWPHGPDTLQSFCSVRVVINYVYYTAVSLALYAVNKGYIHVAKPSCIQLLMIHSVMYVYVRHCQFFRYHHVAMSLYYIIQH